MDRERAVELVEGLVDTVESDPMPVPVREVWVYGDVALGLDPVERLDVYVTKDLVFDGDPADPETLPSGLAGVEGVGETVSAAWARAFPEHVRANERGHVAPERCLAAHLLPADAPVHLEVCNTSFDDNVTRRLEGARARGDYETALDPRGALLWADGERSAEAFERLREGAFVFPTLREGLEMLGLDDAAADAAATAIEARRADQDGTSVRGDVV
ncbi:MAG: hypothetical protein ABEJ42_08450 [Halobacteriaceae archaeon]